MLACLTKWINPNKNLIKACGRDLTGLKPYIKNIELFLRSTLLPYTNQQEQVENILWSVSSERKKQQQQELTLINW